MSPLRLPRVLLAALCIVLFSFGLWASTTSNASLDLPRGNDDSPSVFVASEQRPIQEPLAVTTLTSSVSALPSRGSESFTNADKATKESPIATKVTSPDDVVLILKTGSSSIWRRLPLHLLTTFANKRVPNFAIYSDAAEQLSPGFEAIDTLANVTHLLRKYDSKAHSIYTSQKEVIQPHLYREQAGLPGDGMPSYSDDGNLEGWVLDRWKFLPMLAHAYQVVGPNAKWFIYIEDDTYIFWHNILQWISRLPQGEASYHGAISGPSNATFAQGGSGIIFSQALMARLFASQDAASLETYGAFTAQSCCGDIILGDILRDYGVKINGGEFGSLAFRPEPPWKTSFDVAIWCEPVLTFHHLHQQDMAALAGLEEELLRDNRFKVLFRDVYMKFIDPHLQVDRMVNWNNFADLFVLTSTGAVPEALKGAGLNVDAATQSSKGCQEACQTFSSCFSWRFSKDSCSLDTGVRLGRAVAAEQKDDSAVVSGWILSRLNHTLLSHECWGFRDWDTGSAQT